MIKLCNKVDLPGRLGENCANNEMEIEADLEVLDK